MRDVLFLVKHGVPWDVANGLDADERAAFVVMVVEGEGGHTFNWRTLQWSKRA